VTWITGQSLEVELIAGRQLEGLDEINDSMEELEIKQEDIGAT